MGIKKILLLVCLPILIYAKVNIVVQSSFYQGDSVVFKITASGENIAFPAISTIGNYTVRNAGTSSSTTIINGARSQSISKSYSFNPTKDVTIPSFGIEINGKVEKTKSKILKIQIVQKTVSSDYDLQINVNKKDVYVGEDILFTLIFKYKQSAQIVDLNFYKPNFDGFWSKELQSNNKQSTQGEYIVQELNYLLFPQQSGSLSISPLRIDTVVASGSNRNYGFFGSSGTKSIPVYSNKISLDVKPLPQDIKLIGDFKINATVNKQTINSGDAVSFKLTIEGRGNVDDISEIKLDIPKAAIYDNPSTKEFNIKNSNYGGIYSKTYSIVAQENITIPSVSLRYFDKETKSIKVIKTKTFDIKVNNVVKKISKLEVAPLPTSKETIKEKIVTKTITTSDNQKLIFFLLGMILMGVIISIYNILKNKNFKSKDDMPLIKQIKKTNTSVQLLKIIVVYININNTLDKLIYKLEQTNESDFKEIKKEIIDIVKGMEL